MSPISEPQGMSEALIESYAMIIFSEIGDKTFLIAAILAMRHPRAAVFAGAISSLIVMSILSAVMGHILPTLIPKKWTQFAAAFLFLIFGTKMMVDAKRMQGENKIQEEMREAEEEIKDDDAGDDGSSESDESFQLEDLEEAKGTLEARPAPPSVRTSRSTDSFSKGLRNFFSLFLGPVFVQAFILTFLGEWGDRSQIATIALGAAHVSMNELFHLCGFHAHSSSSERVSRYAWDSRRALMLYSSCSNRWEVCINKDLSKTRCAALFSLYELISYSQFRSDIWGSSSLSDFFCHLPLRSNHNAQRSRNTNTH